MIRFTWWVAAFTSCLAIVGSIQAYAFIQSERAFLVPISAHFEGFAPSADKQLQLWLEIKNSGHSTARIENLNVSYFADKLPMTPEYNKDSSIAFAPIIGGGTIPAFSKSSYPNGTPFMFPQIYVSPNFHRRRKEQIYTSLRFLIH
jgi:hypothetical protein